MGEKQVTKRILEGVRVVELSLYTATPMTGRLLAALGAEVIKIESNKALDETWFGHPLPGHQQAEWRLLKRNLSLNLNHPKAKEIMAKLLQKTDVFMTNLGRAALARWDIDFPKVRELKEDIILLHQTAFGEVGPYAGYKGYGLLMQHSCGISSMTGTADHIGVANSVYEDYQTYMFCSIALLSALDRRRRTGKGTFIECPLFNSGAWTVGPALLDYQANGVVPARIGNKDNFAAPHGAYPCRGRDRWCVIAVFSDEEWLRFCDVLGNPAWTKAPDFETIADRLKNSDRLDSLVAEWTINYTPAEVMDKMQAAGIAAGIVAKGEDIAQDDHLKSREFYKQSMYIVPDSGKPGSQWQEAGPVPLFSEPIRFSETPCMFGPMARIGQDNEYVCGKLLGMSQDEIAALIGEGVLV